MKNHLQFKAFVVSLFICFGNLAALAQAPTIQWDKTIGGNHTDELRAVKQTADGGYIIGGYSNSCMSGDKSGTCYDQSTNITNDFWVVKLNAAGNKQWDKTIGGSNQDMLYSLAQTSDGGYILGGKSESNNSHDKTQNSKGGYDYWVVKLSPTGNILWDKTLGGSSNDNLSGILQTADGGYIIGGSSESGSSGDKSQLSKGGVDYWVVKLDAAGNKIWDKSLGGNLDHHLSTIQQTADGGYILGGSSDSGISGNKTQANKGNIDYWLVKLDGTGIAIWDKTLGGSGVDAVREIQQTADGGYIVGGYSNSTTSSDKSEPNRGDYDYWIVKLNATGTKVWDKSLGGQDADLFQGVIQTSDGGFIAAGFSYSNSTGDKTELSNGLMDYWLVKLNAYGNLLWDKGYGGNYFDYLYGISNTSDGNLILAGASDSDLSGDKTSAIKGSYDYWIVKLGTNNTTVISEQNPNFNLSISPNPSQGKFQLQLNNLSAKTAAITVSDLAGRTVYQQEIPVIVKQLNQEINLLAVKGMYLLQIKAGNQIFTRKIVLE